MPRFAANLSTLFTEVPLLDRFARAAAAGFAAVECQFPYAEAVEDVAAARRDAGLEQVLINMPPGDWDAGERGLAALPGRDDAFAASVETALDYARALDCPRLHCMAGMVPPDADPVEVEGVYVTNLRRAAARCLGEGRMLLVEALNPHDVPGYFLSSQAQAARIVAQVGAANLRVQFDAFHVARVGDDPATEIEALLPLVGHVQIADVPGRHEPGSGTVDFARFFATLDRLGYAGWVGCEYHPAAATEAGLGWRASFA